MATSNGFKGNKAALPSKPCLVCGRDMVWRKIIKELQIKQLQQHEDE